MHQARLLSYFLFVVCDLGTTWWGLSIGLRETEPGAYLLGTSTLAILAAGLAWKLVVILAFEAALMLISKRQLMRLFVYGGLAFIGIVATIQNLRFLGVI